MEEVMTTRTSLTTSTALVGAITLAGVLLMPASAYAQRPDGAPTPGSAPVTIVNPLPLPVIASAPLPVTIASLPSVTGTVTIVNPLPLPVIASAPFPVTLASLPPLTGTVTIANTPLPVAGRVDINTLPPISGTVSLAADSPVAVSNTVLTPLFVRNVADRFPFDVYGVKEFAYGGSEGDVKIFDIFAVPVNQTLVVEFVSIYVRTGQALEQVELLGGPSIPCHQTVSYTYTCSSPVKYYAHQMAGLSGAVKFSTWNSYALVVYYVSGYLVPLDQ